MRASSKDPSLLVECCSPIWQLCFLYFRCHAFVGVAADYGCGEPAGAKVLAGMWRLPLKHLVNPLPITGSGKRNRMCQQQTQRVIFMPGAKELCQQWRNPHWGCPWYLRRCSRGPTGRTSAGCPSCLSWMRDVRSHDTRCGEGVDGFFIPCDSF